VRVGVIAEDQSDVDVVDELLAKVTTRKYVIKRFLGHGSGRVVGKCSEWARVLRDQGCTRLIVVYDLDTGNLPEVRARLRGALGQCPITRHTIIIPVREIEAWLLADEVSIARIAKPRRVPRPIPNPERFMRPKETLRDLIERLSERRITYVNTIHNKQLAKHAALVRVRRCMSFQDLERFAVQTLR